MRRKLIIAGLAIAVLALFFAMGLDERLNFQTLLDALETIRLRASAEPLQSGGLFFCLYVAMAALNLPGAILLTPAAGVIFGTLVGSVWVSLASTIGATLGFLAARYLLREFFEARFAGVTERVNRGIREDGAYYLLGLRLVPIVPFFVINPVMGLTRLPTWTFFWISQVGMLPATVIYVNAGAQLGRIGSVSGVLSPALLGSLALLAIFPFAARRTLAWIQTRRLCARFTRPKRFDANLVVIGAGSAGLVTAYVAATARAKVVLIEADRMGGDCLNTGCVPSKALIRSGRVAALLRRAGEFGLAAPAAATDFMRVMERVRRVVERIEPHDSVERYRDLGVDCVQGRARLTSPWTVAVTMAGGERTIAARSIVLATGGAPSLPPIPGLRDVPHVTSDSVWELADLPARLLVLGGGPIGCELAQAFAQLGSKVTLVEMLPGLLPREDDAAGTILAEVFEASGIRVLTGCRAEAFERRAGGGRLRCVHGATSGDVNLEIDFDMALIAVGRTARTAGLGLEELGIGLNANGTVSVNEYLQTRLPHIYACGDAAGPWQLTHVAAHQAWYCAMNALWGRFWRFRADYSVLPAAVYTDPEVARVGLTEAEARATGQKVETVTYDLGDLDRAITDGEARGFVKVVTPRDSDRILGVTIVGAHAGDTISEFVLAMRHGLGLRKILGTVHSYPTWSEGNKFAAGAWQRRHLPGRLLALAGWFNSRQL